MRRSGTPRASRGRHGDPEAQVRAGQVLAYTAAGCTGIAGLAFLALVLALSTIDIGGCEFRSGFLDSDGGFVSIDGPGKGTSSRHILVDVSPREGLSDGSVVTVTSDAFEADHVVSVTVCLREADLDAEGVEACDTTNGYRYATDGTGHLQATYPVPRVITVQGRAYDCARTTSRCIVVAADASDFDHSGGQAIGFRVDLPDVATTPAGPRPATDHLPVTGVPSSPVGPDTVVEVSVLGLQPGEPVLIARCVRFPERQITKACEPLDQTEALGALAFRTTSGVTRHAAPDGSFVLDVTATRSVTPFGADERDAPVPCTSAEAGCSIVVAAAADTRRSAVLPYWVR